MSRARKSPCSLPPSLPLPFRHLKVSSALKEIDAEGVLFFLGILLAVAALNAAGLLKVRCEGGREG
jgi:hypothetical protein